MKHLYNLCIAVIALTAFCSCNAQSQITPFITAKKISLTLLWEKPEEFEFRVVSADQDNTPWQKPIGQSQIVSAAGSVKCQVKVKNTNSDRAITFDLLNGIVILPWNDTEYLRQKMSDLSFCLTVEPPVGKFVGGWQSGGVEYKTNSLFVQNHGGNLYSGSQPTEGKAQLLRPLTIVSNSPLIFLPIIKENMVEFAVNFVNPLEKEFEFQHITSSGKESQWKQLGYSIKENLDLAEKFKIRVREQSDTQFAEFGFDNSCAISFNQSTVQYWQEKLLDLTIAVSVKGVISDKEVEIVKWIVNKKMFDASGAVWISCRQGNLFFKATQEVNIPLPDADTIILKPVVGGKQTKPDPPSLTPDIPKNREQSPPPPAPKSKPILTAHYERFFLFRN